MKAHFLHNAVFLLSLFSLTTSSPDHPPSNSSSRNVEPPSEALALLAFKSKADLHDKLPFSPNTSSSYCKWQGVECQHGKVVRFVLQGLNLSGVFAPNTLTRLDQLRVLSLQNNSLTGAIPELSQLDNLKAVFLDHNSFAGSFPPSVTSLHRLKTLDLSYNNLTGSLPVSLTNLDRLYYLRLDSNRFNGSIPPLNQSSLRVFNVSRNNLTGAVPAPNSTQVRYYVVFAEPLPLLVGHTAAMQFHTAFLRPFYNAAAAATATNNLGKPAVTRS
ncbi:hypothetical protein RJ640_006950 [Escallonia rubra]|uniref:Leucine-rich repeat-containing N-terminal plant-type domain-containing protein n=1 Tax=Escallonia rubra TaxID=112253 RepID=A0AA88U1M7_9ASTE|nr:hypothetical protein RJ640_006950 [Escallonia rubra]